MSRIQRPSLADIIAVGRAPTTLRYRTGHALVRHRPREFEGHFRVEQIHGPTGHVLQDTGWFRNVIVDAGLDSLATRAITAAIAFVGAGTGNTAPTEADTGLESVVGNSSTAGVGDNVYSWGPSNAYLEYTRVRDFAQGAIIGNIAEVGVASNNLPVGSGHALWSRQVLPVAITFPNPNDNILRVSYRLRVYPGAGDPNGAGYWDPFEDEIQLTLNEVGPVTQATDIQSRALNIGGSAWSSSTQGFFHNPGLNDLDGAVFETNTLPAHTGNLSGTSASSTSRTLASYTPGSFYRESALVWSPSSATPNGFSTGIGALRGWGSVSGIGNAERTQRWAMVFNPKIPKDDTRQVTLVQRVAWGRRAATDVV